MKRNLGRALLAIALWLDPNPSGKAFVYVSVAELDWDNLRTFIRDEIAHAHRHRGL